MHECGHVSVWPSLNCSIRLLDRLCRLCRVGIQRSAKRLPKSGKRRVIAALESPSPRNDGARRQVKVQAVASDTARVFISNTWSR